MTIRSAHLPSGAQKSWIDFETTLPTGILEKYFIYIHNVSGEETTTRIRLQIWRPLDIINYQFQLVWSRTVEVDIREQRGILYTVSNHYYIFIWWNNTHSLATAF